MSTKNHTPDREPVRVADDRTSPPFPDMEGQWAGGRKATPDEAMRALARLRALRERIKPFPESILELRNEGRR